AEGKITATSQRLDDYEAAIGDSISSAILAIRSTVSGHDDQIEAQSDFIASLNSLVGDNAAGGLLRIFTAATSEGAEATAALSVAVDTETAATSAAVYLS